eukprot:TRINITY_DN6345_c0_g1_i2.p1 TRINITY_DN6345_c0_g1~~TRINITY_DN6345_c0_g1_i2.p1  ORF type:complete len:125 (+),score=47.51 TRINITY_DN6345_c0_g1_i2:17-391(+)
MSKTTSGPSNKANQIDKYLKYLLFISFTIYAFYKGVYAEEVVSQDLEETKRLLEEFQKNNLEQDLPKEELLKRVAELENILSEKGIGLNFWDDHGWWFLIGLAILPRITLCCCSNALAGAAWYT